MTIKDIVDESILEIKVIFSFFIEQLEDDLSERDPAKKFFKLADSFENLEESLASDKAKQFKEIFNLIISL